MKILAAITNYGSQNDRYLARILREYRGMREDVDIVVTSNIAKDLGPDVEMVVGLPSRDPWSLGFAHKRIFAERSTAYDLFIYSEDDMLITQRNVDAFLRATEILPKDEIAGLFRIETDPTGKSYLSDVRQHYRWEAGSVCSRGEDTYAFFTNEHAACYMLTREQLGRAIKSGGFLVEPHEGRYDLLCTAATDPYTQCGFRKMICISSFDDFLVHHLSNKYAGTCILGAEEFYSQLRGLQRVAANGKPKETLFPVETKVYRQAWSKDYYEPCQEEILSAVPEGVRSVLSVGCGWGATEQRLVEKGIRVKGVPVDSVIAVSAEARGVEVVHGDLESAREQLENEQFDCVLLSNVLHLVPDPVKLLSSFAELLSPGGCMISSVPNLSRGRRISRRVRLRGKPLVGHSINPRSYDASGMHITTGRVLRRWFREAGLTCNRIDYENSAKQKRADRLAFGLARPMLASSVYVSGVRGE